jgi:hypothetical protein
VVNLAVVQDLASPGLIDQTLHALTPPDDFCTHGSDKAALKPSHVLLYGGNVGFDFGATELIEHKAGGFHGR